MKLQIATRKSTGTRYFYSTAMVFGRKRYTADCSSACVGNDALAITWHPTLSEARKTAEDRGTLELA
jgi:hypothetical protein